MTKTTYRVTKITSNDQGQPVTKIIGEFPTRWAATVEAQKIAGRKASSVYGPNAQAIYGKDITAVVSW